MAQLTGLSGLGGPIDYMQLVPDFRGEALKTSQANAMDVQSQARQQEMANQQRDDARKQAFYGAISTATPDQLPALRKQFPEFAQNIQQEIGIQDATHAAFVNNALGRIQVAYASGDPQQVQAAIQNGAPALNSIGVQPDLAMQMSQNNPQQFGSLLNASMLSTLPVDKQFDVRNDQNKLAETVRSNQAGEALTSRGQDITMRGQNISAQNAALDRDIKRSELKDKALDRQISRETNEVRLGNLREQQTANQQAVTQKMQDYVGAHQSNVNNVTGMLDTVNQVKGNDPVNGIKPDDFDRVFGFGGKVNSLIPGSPSADAWSKIEQMQGQARLMGVIGMKGTGPVSDSEGQAAARSFLAINQNMSPKAARSAIDNWQKTLQRQASYLNKQQPTVNTYQQRINEFNGVSPAPSSSSQTSSPQQGGYSSLWGD